VNRLYVIYFNGFSWLGHLVGKHDLSTLDKATSSLDYYAFIMSITKDNLHELNHKHLFCREPEQSKLTTIM